MSEHVTHRPFPPAAAPPAGGTSSLNGVTTLVLNADWRPIRTVDWKKALNGLVRGIMYPVAHYDIWLRSPSLRQQLPAVVVLYEFADVYHAAALTRRNLMLVYGMRCALCGDVFKAEELTREHLIPQSRGGGHGWDNIVPACEPCNQGKANRTLEEAGIRLKYPVKRAPTGLDVLQARLSHDFAEPPHPSWNDFLGKSYWDTPIDG